MTCVVVGPICPLLDYTFNPKIGTSSAQLARSKASHDKLAEKYKKEPLSDKSVFKPSVTSKVVGYIIAAPLVILWYVVIIMGLIIGYAIVAILAFGAPIIVSSWMMAIISCKFIRFQRLYVWIMVGVIVSFIYPFVAPIDVLKICSSNTMVAHAGLAISGAISGLIMHLAMRSIWLNK